MTPGLRTTTTVAMSSCQDHHGSPYPATTTCRRTAFIATSAPPNYSNNVISTHNKRAIDVDIRLIYWSIVLSPITRHAAESCTPLTTSYKNSFQHFASENGVRPLQRTFEDPASTLTSWAREAYSRRRQRQHQA